MAGDQESLVDLVGVEPTTFRAGRAPKKSRYKWVMENRTEPKTAREWIRYIVVAVIAIWLVIWMLRISGINIL